MPYRNMDLKDRQEHIKQWIEVLKTYQNYDVGLAESISDMELFNKSFVSAMVRASPFNVYPDCDKNAFSGLRFVLYSNEVSVLRFF